MPYNLGDALKNGLKMFTPVTGQVVFISLLFSVPAGLLSWAMSRGADETLRETSNNLKVTNIYNSIIGLFGTIAVLALFMGVAEGQKLRAIGSVAAPGGPAGAGSCRCVRWRLATTGRPAKMARGLRVGRKRSPAAGHAC